jgi:hypothetical protein
VKTQDFTAGTHLFTATADDGVRVYLEGTLVIDQWKDQPPTTYTASRLIGLPPAGRTPWLCGQG